MTGTNCLGRSTSGDRTIERKVADLKVQGIILNPVMFDPETFVAFCLAKNLPCGSEDRALFAAETGMKEMS
jgi:hypothetical protein